MMTVICSTDMIYLFLGLILAMSASEVQSSLQTWIDQAKALASHDCRSDDGHFLPEIKVTVSVFILVIILQIFISCRHYVFSIIYLLIFMVCVGKIMHI